VGIEGQDVEFMAQYSPYFLGTGDAAGKNGYFTALGVFSAMQVALENKFGSDSFINRKIAVKGIGKVGSELTKLLHTAGANILIADINQEKITEILSSIPDLQVVSPDKIALEDVDIFSPCALGNEINRNNIDKIRAKIICGAANNQLDGDEMGEMLHHKGILYAPDFVVNCGGLINVVNAYQNGYYDISDVYTKVVQVKNRLANMIYVADSKNISTTVAANNIAKLNIETMAKVNEILLV